MSSSDFEILELTPGDASRLEELRVLFGDAFEEAETYERDRPDADYLRELLTSDTFIALVALRDGRVAGGIVAYELRKLEQKRREIYLYDLAVRAADRRRGVAMALISELRRIARKREAYVIFVQADLVDEPAVRLYTKLGLREDVLHFDIQVDEPT